MLNDVLEVLEDLKQKEKDIYVKMTRKELVDFTIKLIKFIKNMEDKDLKIENNLKLIKFTIKKLNLHWNTEDEFQEYYDNGLLGLINGINNYDENKGIAESTFYYTCIKNSILRGIRVNNQINKKANINCKSLNEVITDEKEVELIETIPDKYDLEKDMENKLMYEEIVRYVERLGNLRDEMAFKMYYGIGEEAKTYAEIAKIMNISQERVRQITSKVRNKIKERFKDTHKLIETG